MHSCTLCKRKVKCDKQRPCSNCVRGQRDCFYADPVPPRRRKGRGKLSEDDLLRRLRHYEILLKSYGEKMEEVGSYYKDKNVKSYKYNPVIRLSNPGEKEESSYSVEKEIPRGMITRLTRSLEQ